MRYSESELLRSEIAAVKRFLRDTPETSPIMRMSWESRLKSLQMRLSELKDLPESQPLSITFKGAPVEGTRSIDAAFASDAVHAFVTATDTVTASLVKGSLGERGRLPEAGGRSLRIVGTAVGSFGFQLELPPPAKEPAQIDLDLLKFDNEDLHAKPIEDLHVKAIETTLQLLNEAAVADDDAISDLIAEIDPRAALKIRAFVKTIADNGALFAIGFRDQQVLFDNNEQLQKAIDALSESDISENEESHVGTLIGVLPAARRFEAKLPKGQLLEGIVDRSVPDINAFKADWENVEAKLSFRVLRVRNRTKYILHEATALEGEGGDNH